MTKPTESEIREVLLSLAMERGRGATFCPWEAAKRLPVSDPKAILPEIRFVSRTLVEQGRLRCTRKGMPVCPEHPGGPIRLGLA